MTAHFLKQMHVVDVVDHLFSPFTIATQSTGAFTLIQAVSCHLHSTSVTMVYVRRQCCTESQTIIDIKNVHIEQHFNN